MNKTDSPVYFKGDKVRTKSGKTAEIVDAWGVVRNWYKLKTTDGEIIITMSDQIDSLIRCVSDKKRTGWGKT